MYFADILVNLCFWCISLIFLLFAYIWCNIPPIIGQDMSKMGKNQWFSLTKWVFLDFPIKSRSFAKILFYERIPLIFGSDFGTFWAFLIGRILCCFLVIFSLLLIFRENYDFTHF